MTIIRKGTFLTLNNIDPIPYYEELQGHHHINAYKILQSPQYSFTEIENIAYNNNLLRQKMFLDTIKDLFLSNTDVPIVVELRFHSNPIEKTIEPYIIIKAFDRGINNSFTAFIKDFETFLPEDYVYQNVPSDNTSDLIDLDLSNVIEVRKNISLIPVGKVKIGRAHV